MQKPPYENKTQAVLRAAREVLRESRAKPEQKQVQSDKGEGPLRATEGNLGIRNTLHISRAKSTVNESFARARRLRINLGLQRRILVIRWDCLPPIFAAN